MSWLIIRDMLKARRELEALRLKVDIVANVLEDVGNLERAIPTAPECRWMASQLRADRKPPPTADDCLAWERKLGVPTDLVNRVNSKHALIDVLMAEVYAIDALKDPERFRYVIGELRALGVDMRGLGVEKYGGEAGD